MGREIERADGADRRHADVRRICWRRGLRRGRPSVGVACCGRLVDEEHAGNDPEDSATCCWRSSRRSPRVAPSQSCLTARTTMRSRVHGGYGSPATTPWISVSRRRPANPVHGRAPIGPGADLLGRRPPCRAEPRSACFAGRMQHHQRRDRPVALGRATLRPSRSRLHLLEVAGILRAEHRPVVAAGRRVGLPEAPGHLVIGSLSLDIERWPRGRRRLRGHRLAAEYLLQPRTSEGVRAAGSAGRP